MHGTSSPNDEQSKLWNGPSGRAWIDTQRLLDTLFTPFQDLLVEALAKRPESRVLDVGCGTGSTTRALAKQGSVRGRCIGIDISGPMIEVARLLAEREGSTARFICDDVQRHSFERASFDTIVSRFGVMFFADAVEAFANLRHAASEQAGLHFIAWRSAAENPFMTTPERAAAPLLPALPPRRPGAPGQFAFEDPHRIAAILEASGWNRIEIRPIDVPCSMPKTGLVDYLTKLGPVGRALETADEATRGRVVDAVRVACEPYVHGDTVSFTAACWFVEAKASPD
ncbi:class I SAM-dependent methyltransferase [Paraburkholderia sp. J12]|uniref:class I SAM-dependent methyltransferase n=1 Tax=Paraburkholderia sp. J12 TaxID=2805432 RepID=UPI002ABD3A00|nr:class I SAM-dependent methyltransferase [Paraburkholderia sp. J12]